MVKTVVEAFLDEVSIQDTKSFYPRDALKAMFWAGIEYEKNSHSNDEEVENPSLLDLREKAGFTQIQAASILGVESWNIINIETGKNTGVDKILDLFFRMAILYKVEYDFLHQIYQDSCK